MAEIRHTDWICNPAMPGIQYRIWKRCDGMVWHQRHEWRWTDGSERLDPWIPSVGPFQPHYLAACGTRGVDKPFGVA